MSSHVNVAFEAVGALDAVAHCTSSISLSLHSESVTSTTAKSSVSLESSSSLQLLWSEAVSSPSKLYSISSSNKHFLLDAIIKRDCSFNWNPDPKTAVKEQSVDIWGRWHTPFQSYIVHVRVDSKNIRFLFHFTVRGTHKSVCEIRECKNKTRNSREEKKWINNL